jgi:hypothetical protein
MYSIVPPGHGGAEASVPWLGDFTKMNGRGQKNNKRMNYEYSAIAKQPGQVSRVTDSAIARQTVIGMALRHRGFGHER